MRSLEHFGARYLPDDGVMVSLTWHLGQRAAAELVMQPNLPALGSPHSNEREASNSGAAAPEA